MARYIESADPSAPRTTSRARLAAAGLTIAVAAAGAVVGFAGSAHASASGSCAATSTNGTFLAHLNGLRESHGLRPLVESGDLVSIATSHSYVMCGQQTIFHNPSLTTQVQNWQVVGENVGMGGSASAIDSAFDASPDHYSNEVSTAYTQVGIGTATDSRGYLYVTLDFRKPMYTTPAPRPAAPRPAAPATHATPRYVAARTVQATATRPAAAHATPVPHFTLPSGTDPVANALRFSILMRGMH